MNRLWVPEFGFVQSSVFASLPSCRLPRKKLYIYRMVKDLNNSLRWQDQFFKQLARPRTLLDLFDSIPGVYMYIKDVESRFVRANRVVCDVVGVGHPDELIGHTDFEFFPPAIAAQYVAEDQRVITTGESLSDQVWMVPGKNGVPRLYLCSKIPLLDQDEKVVGIAGVKRPYEYSADDSAGYSRLGSGHLFHYRQPRKLHRSQGHGKNMFICR